MAVVQVSRAGAYSYSNGAEWIITPGTFVNIPFGDTESAGDLEQCFIEFDVDPSTINTALPVTVTFKLEGCQPGTKNVRRWTSTFPTNYGETQGDFLTATNQVPFTATGTATVTLNITSIVDDAATNSQPKLIIGIRETGDDNIYGFINYDDVRPTLTHGVAASNDGTAVLDVDDITVIAVGRANTIAGTSSLDLIDIELDAEAMADLEGIFGDASLELDLITLESTAAGMSRGTFQGVITVSLESTEGKVHVKGSTGSGESSLIVVNLLSNNHVTEGTATLRLDDILVSGEIPQGGEPRVGVLNPPVITVSLNSFAAPKRFGELTPDPIIITLYARIAEAPPSDADSPFLDSNIPLFLGQQNATFRGGS